MSDEREKPVRERYPKSHKIWRSNEISEIIRKGHRWRCPLFLLRSIKNKCNYDRMAVIVSRKNGNAVKRTRIKRLYREAFRREQRKNPPYFDVIIRPVSDQPQKFEKIREEYRKWKEQQK